MTAGPPPVTLRSLQRAATARVAAAGVPSAALDARLLICAALGLSRQDLLCEPERPVSPAEAAAVEALVDRRVRREPVSRILGRREFWSLEFAVTPATLDPRPDTETVVSTALDLLPDRAAPWSILDLGTGSGCILLALLSELPAARGLGIDAAPAAVEAAAANAVHLGLDARARFRTGDWTAGLFERFDLVVANPPYIPETEIAALEPEVAVYEPRAALAGGADGLDAYRRIITGLGAVLAPRGGLVFEVGAGQAQAVAALLSAAGLGPATTSRDLSGIDRCVVVNNLR